MMVDRTHRTLESDLVERESGDPHTTVFYFAMSGRIAQERRDSILNRLIEFRLADAERSDGRTSFLSIARNRTIVDCA